MLARRLARPQFSAKHCSGPRCQSSNASSTSAPTPGSPPKGLDRVAARLPPFLRRYIEPLRSAPLSHITSFLVLHEVTAVVPLFGLAGLLHYSSVDVPDYIKDSRWVQESTGRWERYARKKGWVVADEEVVEEVGAVAGKGLGIVMELAIAWAAVKALLPLRLGFSVWATPGFARMAVLPMGRLFARLGKRGTAGRLVGVGQSPAAGTNAVGGGVIGRAGGPRPP